MVPALALALFLPLPATDWTTVYSYPSFEVDNDDSIVDFPIQFPFTARQLRIRFTDAAGSVCGAVLDSVDVVQGSAGAAATPYGIPANGTIELSGSPEVYSLTVHQHQPNYSRSYCAIDIDANATGGGGSTDGYTYLDVIHYRGGFVNQTELAAPAHPFVTAVKVDVPQFCGNVDVLEAGTVTEGQYDKGAATDAAGVFEVNQGAGSRISGVRVSLNGPLTSQCDIPVYVQVKN